MIVKESLSFKTTYRANMVELTLTAKCYRQTDQTFMQEGLTFKVLEVASYSVSFVQKNLVFNN